MSEMMRIFLRVLRRNAILIVGLCVLVAVVVVTRVSRFDTYASTTVANVDVSSGIISGDDFTVNENTSFYAQNAVSSANDLSRECVCLNAASSLCYEYTVTNISSGRIAARVEYTQNDSQNFVAYFSVNGSELEELDFFNFELESGETQVVRVVISIADLSQNAFLNGSVSVAAVAI